MALLYYRAPVQEVVDDKVEIRPLHDEGKYVVAISLFDRDDEEDTVREVLLTQAEAQEIADIAFNK